MIANDNLCHIESFDFAQGKLRETALIASNDDIGSAVSIAHAPLPDAGDVRHYCWPVSMQILS